MTQKNSALKGVDFYRKNKILGCKIKKKTVYEKNQINA